MNLRSLFEIEKQFLTKRYPGISLTFCKLYSITLRVVARRSLITVTLIFRRHPFQISWLKTHYIHPLHNHSCPINIFLQNECKNQLRKSTRILQNLKEKWTYFSFMYKCWIQDNATRSLTQPKTLFAHFSTCLKRWSDILRG